MERILRDPEKTCVLMAPAITGSFGTGSSGNYVQKENYNNYLQYLALIYGDKTIKYFFVFLYNIHYDGGSLSKSISLQIPQFPIKWYLPGYL